MLETTDISLRHWVGFIVCVLIFLAFDLGVFHREARVVRFKEALGWTFVWFSLAMVFAVSLFFKLGAEEALEFATGYIIELSLSMDNVFVIAVIFSYFRIPSQYQHRVLFWGILGALVMRGFMIGLGTALVYYAHWVLYLFGAFLLFTGVKMVVVPETGVHPEKNPVIRMARKFCPVTTEIHGQNFFVVRGKRRMLTPLFLVLLMVETTDLVFALDSIPAIFAITQKPFIIFTSNVFAILGLRSLYFVLASALDYFRYLKIGLSIVLMFVGLKMLASNWVHLQPVDSLAIVLVILLVSVLVSVISARREQRATSGHRERSQ